MEQDNWISVDDRLPENGIVVDTKVDYGNGDVRNEQQLKRSHRLWFVPDGTMYIYYTPTHWRGRKYV